MPPSFQRSVLITGGTAGLGYYCALNIARQHPDYQIVIASRTDLNGSAASINQLLDQSNVSYMHLDLSKLAQIRQFVNEWEARQYPPIQALLLNAGLQFPAGIQYTEDDFESTFAVQPYRAQSPVFLDAPPFHRYRQDCGDLQRNTRSSTEDRLAGRKLHDGGRARASDPRVVQEFWTPAVRNQQARQCTLDVCAPSTIHQRSGGGQIVDSRRV